MRVEGAGPRGSWTREKRRKVKTTNGRLAHSSRGEENEYDIMIEEDEEDGVKILNKKFD